jgi:hypothetical protein
LDNIVFYSEVSIINQVVRFNKLKTISMRRSGVNIISKIRGSISICWSLKNNKIVTAVASKNPRRLLSRKKLVKKKIVKKIEAKNGR